MNIHKSKTATAESPDVFVILGGETMPRRKLKPLQYKYSVTDIANGMFWLKLIDHSSKVSIIKLSIMK